MTTIRVRQPDASELMPGIQMSSVQHSSVDSIVDHSLSIAQGRVKYLTFVPHPRQIKDVKVVIVAAAAGSGDDAVVYSRSIASFANDVHTLVPAAGGGALPVNILGEQLAWLIKKVHSDYKQVRLASICGPELLELSMLLAGWRELQGENAGLSMRRMYDRLVIRGANAPDLGLLASFTPAKGSAPLLVFADLSHADAGDVQDIREMLNTRLPSWPAGTRVALWTITQPQSGEARRETEMRLTESFLRFNDAAAILGGISDAKEHFLKLGGELY